MIRGHILKKAIWSPGKFPQITEIRVLFRQHQYIWKIKKAFIDQLWKMEANKRMEDTDF